MSKKLVIMKRLTTLLGGTPIVYNYKDETGASQSVTYNLSGKVFRGRKFLSPADIPDYGVSIMESPRPSIGDPVGYNDTVRREDWTLNVQGFPVDDPVNPSDPAYLMAAAVEERLTRVTACGKSNPVSGDPGKPDWPDVYMLGGLITGLTIGGTVVLPAQENLSRFAYWYTPIILSIVKDARS